MKPSLIAELKVHRANLKITVDSSKFLRYRSIHLLMNDTMRI